MAGSARFLNQSKEKMMKINQAFPSKYVAAVDMGGLARVLTISQITMETIGQDGHDTKPVLYFQGAQKGMVLNKTNANVITILYGEETDNWIGKQIELYPTQTDFRGEIVDCIRCRAPGAVGALGAAPAAAPLPADVLAHLGPHATPTAPPADGGHTPEVTDPFKPEKPFSEAIGDEVPF